MISIIAKKELRSIFTSPTGWIILALMQFCLGTYFTLSFNQYFEILSIKGSLPEQMGITKFMCEGVFDTASILFVFVIPIISMRLLSDEYRSQTITFLMSAPISITEIILGKYLALLIYMTSLILIMVGMILTLGKLAWLDYGLLFANALGLWLLMATLSAMGLFFSSQTQYAVIAGFLTFLTSSALILVDKFTKETTSTLVSQLSIMTHYRNFSNGLINSFNTAYFLIVTLVFIALTIHRLFTHRVPN